jgi:uncharacterized protein
MPIDLLTEYGGFAAAVVLAGVTGGFIAGLLGVGGGIIIVPVLFVILSELGVDGDVVMKTAVATSLATIVFTSLASALSHLRKQAVDFNLLKSWAAPVFAGVLAGVALAAFVPGDVLTAIFAVTGLIVAANMVLRAKAEPWRSGFPNGVVKAALGALVGSVSVLMGIGGGTLSVPILTLFGYDIRRAVGTASALGFVIAIPGTIGYVISGWGVSDLPVGSVGYLNVFALLALVPLTMAFAPLGAKVAHRIPRHILSYSFAVFLAATALRMGMATL